MLSQTRAAVLAIIDQLGVSGGPGVEEVPEMTVTHHRPNGVVCVAPLSCGQWREGMAPLLTK